MSLLRRKQQQREFAWASIMPLDRSLVGHDGWGLRISHQEANGRVCTILDENAAEVHPTDHRTWDAILDERGERCGWGPVGKIVKAPNCDWEIEDGRWVVEVTK